MTRKITRAVARIKMGLEERSTSGNLDAERDWGHAHDYVDGHGGSCSRINRRIL